jgi:hypothetical protein
MSIIAEWSAPSVSSDPRGSRSSLPTPGILVFSHTRHLQYVNRRACDLIQCADETNREPSPCALPARLLDLRDEIHLCLHDRLEAGIREPFEVSRVMCEGEKRLLLRGYGRPGYGADVPARIIILVEAIERAVIDER